MSVKVLGTQAPAISVSRPCDTCGEPFRAKNDHAAFMMMTGKLRVCDNCRRAGARTQLPYAEYLKTEHWQSRRKRSLILGEYKCRVCGNEERPLDVHHNTYERLGHENDADLVVLCRDCHQLFHDNGELRF
jgi:hypothetical protein